MSKTPEPTLSLTTGDGNLQVGFQKVQTAENVVQWQTELHVLNPEKTVVLSSVLESPAIRCPIQELVAEDHGNGPLLLAVGQANRNHWSASITADESVLLLDFACRINRAPEHPGCCFHLQKPWKPEVVTDHVVLTHDSINIVITPNAGSVINWHPDSRQLSFSVAQQDVISAVPMTVTWQIQFELTR